MSLHITKSSVHQTIIFTPVIVKYKKKILDITKPQYSEQILPAPWAFTILRFCCTQQFEILATGLLLSSPFGRECYGLNIVSINLFSETYFQSFRFELILLSPFAGRFLLLCALTDQLSISGIKASKLTCIAYRNVF